MRLQKYMAHCGVASRRKCEEIIECGRVQVNGEVVKDMGVKINPQQDKVLIDGKPLKLEKKMTYILLYKPRGYITSVRDPFNRPTVLKLIGHQENRVYPVGRLDFDSEGLLLLTNDGEMAFRLTHPRHQIEKEYYVVVKGRPNPLQVEELRKGIDIGGYITAPAQVTMLSSTQNQSAFRVVIKEGKNRQIRRMFEAIGHPVDLLRRERMGDLTIKGMKPGGWRELSDSEVHQLKQY